jgi:hypothetical protein
MRNRSQACERAQSAARSPECRLKKALKQGPYAFDDRRRADECAARRDNARMMPSRDEDPVVAHTVAACRLTLDMLSGALSRDFPRLTEPLVLTFASLLSEAIMRNGS